MEAVEKGKVFANFGTWLGDGISVVTSDFVTFILVNLVVLVLSAVTLGILAGPLAAGYIMLVIKKMKGKPIAVGDVFKGFDKFGPALVLFLIGVAVAIAYGVAVRLICYVAALIWMKLAFLLSLLLFPVGFVLFVVVGSVLGLALLHVVDRGLGIGDAIKRATVLVKGDPAGMIVYCAVSGILGGIFAIVTLGFYFASMVKMYDGIVGIQSDPQ